MPTSPTVQPKENQKFHCVVVDPDKVIFEGQVRKVIVPGKTQDIAILPDHTPLYAEIGKGEIELEGTDDRIKKIPIESGIIRVKANNVSLIIGF